MIGVVLHPSTHVILCYSIQLLYRSAFVSVDFLCCLDLDLYRVKEHGSGKRLLGGAFRLSRTSQTSSVKAPIGSLDMLRMCITLCSVSQLPNPSKSSSDCFLACGPLFELCSS